MDDDNDMDYDNYDTDDLQWRSDEDAWQDSQADIRENGEDDENDFDDEDDEEFEIESSLRGFGLAQDVAVDEHLESTYEDRTEIE